MASIVGIDYGRRRKEKILSVYLFPLMYILQIADLVWEINAWEFVLSTSPLVWLITAIEAERAVKKKLQRLISRRIEYYCNY